VTNVYRASRDLFLAQRFARHASPLKTIVYTHVSDEDVSRRVRGLACRAGSSIPQPNYRLYRCRPTSAKIETQEVDSGSHPRAIFGVAIPDRLVGSGTEDP